MAHGMKDIVLLGKEATRGTAAATTPLHQPIVDDGLIPSIQGNNAETRASSTWPYQTDECPIGPTASLRLQPDVNVNTVRDLILMIDSRTNGDLASFTAKHSRAGIGDAQYLGCVVSELNMQYSRTGQPDRSSILQFDMSLECMKPEAGAGVVAGSQAVGKRFKLEQATITINGAGALEVTEYRRSIRVTLDLGALDAAGKRLYITDGDLEEEISLTARFTSDAWTNLILGKTEHAASIVHATGGANETVTETMGKCQLRSHELSKGNGTVMEQIAIRPFHTGAAVPTVWAFGSAIGASVLGLP